MKRRIRTPSNELGRGFFGPQNDNDLFHFNFVSLQVFSRTKRQSLFNSHRQSRWFNNYNYIISGHNAKISADYTYVDQEGATAVRDNQSIATVQIAVGF